ncbi:MAG: hypothetical protein HUJ27_08190 [Rhodobacteraceae bacterium]|nr:hypothetical protein [Paracoccaceae bacterium]
MQSADSRRRTNRGDIAGMTAMGKAALSRRRIVFAVAMVFCGYMRNAKVGRGLDLMRHRIQRQDKRAEHGQMQAA